METYFDAGTLCVYVTQKTEIILNALQLGGYTWFLYYVSLQSKMFTSAALYILYPSNPPLLQRRV